LDGVLQRVVENYYARCMHSLYASKSATAFHTHRITSDTGRRRRRAPPLNGRNLCDYSTSVLSRSSARPPLRDSVSVFRLAATTRTAGVDGGATAAVWIMKTSVQTQDTVQYNSALHGA